MIGSILVATDGKERADGALRLAQLLAGRTGASIRVVSVYEPTDLLEVSSPEGAVLFPEDYAKAAIEAVGQRVRDQLASIGGGAADWPASVESGRVAATIARVGAEQKVDLIMVGLPQPGGVEQWLARETLLRLAHLASVPVLAVPSDMSRLPQKAAVAIDFSDFSLRAARETFELTASDAELHLVHVMWAPARTNVKADVSEWERTYHAGVEYRLNELAEELGSAGDATIHVQVLAGDAGEELLRFAKETDLDLIAAGSHGMGFLGRIILGSVSSKLVHRTTCSLLIIPPQQVPEELQLDLSEKELLANLGRAGEWVLSEQPGEGIGG